MVRDHRANLERVEAMLAPLDESIDGRAFLLGRIGYGDFVLYRPPFKATTSLLWIGPALLMAGAVGALFVVLRRRQPLTAPMFDEDEPTEGRAEPPNC